MIFKALFTRPVSRRPARFAATVLGVAAGVAAVIATLGASRAALSSLREGVGELSGAAALEVSRPGGVAESELSRLAPLAEDAVLLPVVDRLALYAAPDGSPGDTVRILGIDLIADPRFRAEFKPGDPRQETLLAGAGALVSDALARELSLKDGDELTLTLASKLVAVHIVGTFPSRGATALARLVVVDVASAQRLAGCIGLLDRIELIPRAGVVTDALAARARELVSPGVEVGSPAERAAATSTLVRSLEFNLTTMSAISLLVGGVLVATTLATSVVQRKRTIALMYALGASHGQVVRSILGEALILGVLGGAVGVALGWISAHFMVDGMRATLSTVVSTTAPGTIPFDWNHAAIGLALGVSVALVAGLLPVVEGARTPPIQALRGEIPTFLSLRGRHIALAVAVACLLAASELIQLPAWNGLPIAGIMGALAFLGALFAVFGPVVDGLGRLGGARFPVPLSLRLACAGLSAGRRRAAWAAGAIGVAVALSIAIATLVTSFRATVVDWVEHSIHADFTIRPIRGAMGVPVGRLDPNIVELARAVPGTSAVYPYFVSSALYDGQRIGLGAVSFRAASERGWSAMQDGEDPLIAVRRAARESGVLVTEAGAHRFGWKRGDLLKLEVRGRTLARRISGVYLDHSESQGFVLIDESDFLAYFPQAGPAFIDVNCTTPADVEPVHAALTAATRDRFKVEINDRDTMRSTILSVFDRTFEITRALQAVSAIVAITAVLSVLFAIVAERRADLALLSAIGAGSRQVYALVCTQAGLLGLVGAVLGAVTGLAIGFVLVTVVNLQSFGWTLQFVRPWTTMVTLALFVAAVCVAAGALPARSAPGSTMRDALREE